MTHPLIRMGMRLATLFLATSATFRVSDGTPQRWDPVTGENQHEIEVVNCWPNRLIGDGLMPKDQRRTHTNLRVYEAFRPNGEKKNLKLLPSGLLGPVRVVAIQRGGISK